MQIRPISHVVAPEMSRRTSEVQDARHTVRPSEVVLTPEERKMLYKFFPFKGAEIQEEPRLGKFIDVRG